MNWPRFAIGRLVLWATIPNMTRIEQRYLGRAWYVDDLDASFYTVIPFNWIARKLRNAYRFLRWPNIDEWELRQVAAFEKGRELARKQSNTHEYDRGYSAAMRHAIELRNQERCSGWYLIDGPENGAVVDVYDGGRPELVVGITQRTSMLRSPVISARVPLLHGTYKPTNEAEFQRKIMRWHGPS